MLVTFKQRYRLRQPLNRLQIRSKALRQASALDVKTNRAVWILTHRKDRVPT